MAVPAAYGSFWGGYPNVLQAMGETTIRRCRSARAKSLSLGLDDQTKNQLERKRTPGQKRKHHHHRTDGFQKRLFGREDQQGLKASVFTVVASADQGFRSQKVS